MTRKHIPDPAQLDWVKDFENAEKRWKAAHDIIDQSPTSDRVKALLHMLADCPQSTIDERGNTLVSVSLTKMQNRLLKARNTVKSYVRLACETPYLELLTPDNELDDRTYIIHWLSILNRETTQPDATSTAQRSDTGHQDAISTDGLGSDEENAIEGGGQLYDPGGSTPELEGVNSDPQGGQFDPVNLDFDRVKSPSSEERLKDVLESEVNPTSPDVLNVLDALEGDQSRKKAKPMKPKFWRQWEEAVRVSDLSNAHHVQQLYEMITSMCVIQRCDANRQRVFATAAMNERMWKSKEALRRKGLFLTNTARQIWFFNHLDEMNAKRMMQSLDHPPEAVINARVAVPRDAPPIKPDADVTSAGQKTGALVGKLADTWGLVKTVVNPSNG